MSTVKGFGRARRYGGVAFYQPSVVALPRRLAACERLNHRICTQNRISYISDSGKMFTSRLQREEERNAHAIFLRIIIDRQLFAQLNKSLNLNFKPTSQCTLTRCALFCALLRTRLCIHGVHKNLCSNANNYMHRCALRSTEEKSYTHCYS